MKIFSTKYLCWWFLPLLLPVYGFAQYTGGIQDGASLYTKININQAPNIYYGGIQDGVSLYTKASINAAPNIYYGGTQDGVSSYTKTNTNQAPNIYYGGVQDGVSTAAVTLQNSFDSIYRGGIHDGFGSILVKGQNATPSIYLGGTQDGFSSNIYTNKNQSPSIYLGGADDGYSVYVSTAQNAFSLMVKFKGKWSGSDALLEWDATAQPGIDNFELERSADNGVTFTKITTVPAGTKAAGLYNYAHNDVAAHNLPADNVIYRLKAMAADGNPAYAALVRLDKDKAAPVLLVYPNPNTGRFTLGITNTNDNYDGLIYLVSDATGKALQKGNITNTNTTFNLSGNAAGTYHLSVYKNAKLIQHFTIVIAH